MAKTCVTWASRHNSWHHPSARTPLYGRRRYSGFLTLKLWLGTIFEATWAQDKMGAPDYNAPSTWGGGLGCHSNETGAWLFQATCQRSQQTRQLHATCWENASGSGLSNVVMSSSLCWCSKYHFMSPFYPFDPVLRFPSLYWRVKHDWCRNGPPNCSISLE